MIAALCGCAAPRPVVTSQATGHLAVSSTSLDFGSVPVGSAANAAVSLSNDGSAPLQITKVAVTGSTFLVTGGSSMPITINPGYAYSVTVQFAPTTAGADTGTLTITANSAATPVAVALSGDGQAKEAGPALTLATTTLSFGNVLLNTPETQSVTLTSSGSDPLVVNAVTLTGAGFTVSGVTFPLTLNPTQSATLSVVFDPASTGSFTGSLILASNAGNATVALSGTGETAAHEVDLSWDAPSNPADAAVGYNIYRAVSGSANVQLLNNGLIAATSYADTLVSGGFTYSYYVESVDADGSVSAASNVFTITLPQ
ncbi:MAG: choice-of-anchor D domain-containing protein [Acidobacteriaceae bacterium]